MDDRGALADDLVIDDRDEQMMTGFGQIGGEPGRIDLLVEDVVGDPVEQRFVAGLNLPDLDLHRRSCLHSPNAIDVYVNPNLYNRLKSFSGK